MTPLWLTELAYLNAAFAPSRSQKSDVSGSAKLLNLSEARHSRFHRLIVAAPTGFLSSGAVPLMAIRLTFCCAVGDFGRVTLRTPFLNDASILS